MEDLYDPEEMILCPYNNSHHIRRSRMSFHLVKCKKNYPNQRMLPCDFNATHQIPEPELRYHHQICPDRKRVEVQIVEATTSNSENRFPIVKIDHQIEESWDHLDTPTYDPKKYVEERDILRQLDVESGAKRKNFRLSERQRLGAMSTSDSRPQPQNNEQTMKRIQLPQHRPVIHLEQDTPSAIQQRLKLGQGKIYMQQKPENKEG